MDSLGALIEVDDQQNSSIDASTMTDHQCCSWVPAWASKMEEKQESLVGKIESLIDSSINKKFHEIEANTGAILSKLLEEKQDIHFETIKTSIETIIEGIINKKLFESECKAGVDSMAISLENTKIDEAMDGTSSGSIEKHIPSTDQTDETVDTFVLKFPFKEVSEAFDLNQKLIESTTFFVNMVSISNYELIPISTPLQ